MSEQLDLLAPRELGRTAGEACAEKAEAIAGLDIAGAQQRLIELLAHGPMKGEDLVDRLKCAGFTGHDDRCFGVVFAQLSIRGRIRCVGYYNRRRGHGTAGGRIWGLA